MWHLHLAKGKEQVPELLLDVDDKYNEESTANYQRPGHEDRWISFIKSLPKSSGHKV